jgi:hypothetical protein
MTVAALALAASACDIRQSPPAQGSVTVKLPEARPRAPAPGFSSKAFPQLETKVTGKVD